MWFVYVLKDEKGKIYIGSTNDINRRLCQHRQGLCEATRNMHNLNLEAYIAVKTERHARELERYLKTGSGRAVLHKRIFTDKN